MKKFDEIKRMVDLVREINESIQNDNELLVEANPLGVAAKEGAITAKMLEPLFKDLMVAGREEAALLAKVGVKDSEGLLKLIQNDFKQVDAKLGTLAAKESSRLRAGLELSILKNPSGVNKELLDVAASNLVKDSRFLETYKQYGNEADLVDALKKKGYSDQGAKSIAKERFNPKQTKVKPKPVDPNLPLPVSPPVPKWWKFDWTKNKKWLKRALAVAGAGTALGGIYLAWKTFFGDDDDLPPCLKVLIKDENEFQNYLATGFVIMGNYKFYQDKKVELTSTSGVVVGKWSYNSTNKTIDLDFDGRKTSISCAETTPPQKCTPPLVFNPTTGKCEKKGGGTGRYKVCNKFPYELYCKSEVIRKVQQCLGTKDDSLLGPATENALKANGYSLPLTKEMYDKIVATCGGSGTQQTTADNPYSNWTSEEPEFGESPSTNKPENDNTEG